jgi:colanic acid/amylovoran biosynthesis glycosyltransferase
MKDVLFFFSERYPGEYIGARYEEKEIIALHENFRKVYVIFTSQAKDDESNYFIPPNLTAVFFKPDTGLISKISTLRFLFRKEFYSEIFFIKRVLKIRITSKIIAILFGEFNKGVQLKNCVKSVIKNDEIQHSDSVVYSFWNDYRAIAAALLKVDFPELKVVSRAHSGDVYFERHPFNYLPLKKFIFQTIDGVFFISNHSKNYIVKKINHEEENVFTYKLGVKNQNPLKKYEDGRNLIIASCSSIIDIKRIDLIVRGLGLIDEIPFEWFHFGRDKMNNEIMSLCKELLTKSNQRYSFSGLFKNEQLHEYYFQNQIDLFVNTSKSEGISLAIMEAMSFGIPVIATAVGGTPEIVKDGYNGFLLPENPSPEEFAQKVTTFYRLPFEKKNELRQNAFHTWNNEYNADVNYKRFVERIFSL